MASGGDDRETIERLKKDPKLWALLQKEIVAEKKEDKELEQAREVPPVADQVASPAGKANEEEKKAGQKRGAETSSRFPLKFKIPNVKLPQLTSADQGPQVTPEGPSSSKSGLVLAAGTPDDTQKAPNTTQKNSSWWKKPDHNAAAAAAAGAAAGEDSDSEGIDLGDSGEDDTVVATREETTIAAGLDAAADHIGAVLTTSAGARADALLNSIAQDILNKKPAAASPAKATATSSAVQAPQQKTVRSKIAYPEPEADPKVLVQACKDRDYYKAEVERLRALLSTKQEEVNVKEQKFTTCLADLRTLEADLLEVVSKHRIRPAAAANRREGNFYGINRASGVKKSPRNSK